MQTKDVLIALRRRHNLTQDEMADRLFVTRQAISRWERGETTPNPETLKLISSTFDISINTLLGSPRQLICQCCGMPLDDSSISRENDGSFNEDYCKWCYTDGKFVYQSLNELVDFLVSHLSRSDWTVEQSREYFRNLLAGLSYWKNQN